MPANLTAEAKAKWKLAQNTTKPREKLQALQEFLSEVPKHKGNERLRAQVKTQIAELRRDLIAQRRKRRGGGRSPWSVDHEGAAQVMIFGATKTGKSSLLSSLTHAHVEIASYDYSTQYPVPGMLQYEDIQIQLVELPAPTYDATEGRYVIQTESTGLIRQCDGLVLVVDLSNDPTRQLELTLLSLEAIHISTRKAQTRVEIVPEKGGEIRVAASGSGESLAHEQISDLLHSYGVKSALVRIFGNATVGDVEDAILENVTLYKPTIVMANKLDLDPGRQASSRLLTAATGFPTIIASCMTRQGLDMVGHQLFTSLGLVRVYTKEPNEPRPSPHPFVVREGTTVSELARSIHSDLAVRYRYSRLWGPTSKFAGERVGPEHVLGDRDIVEIHTG